MDLQRLRLFLAVVESGSISAAARAVHLTQPAVTRNIQLLEESLGVALFDRRGRRVVLTPAGRALVPRARGLLEQVERAALEVGRVAERRLFDLRLGSVDSIVSHLFARVVVPLREAFPALAIKLTTGRTAELLARLERGELDLAVVAWSGEPPGARATRVGPYAFGYYGRADLFADLAEVTDESGLGAYPLIEIQALPGQPTLIAADAEDYAIAGSLGAVKALVLGGFGVGGLLDFMLSPDEEARLARAAVEHDPRCGVFVAGADDWRGDAQEAVESALARLLGEALRR
jgi:DNA-binding transcriptional LysR family regulator